VFNDNMVEIEISVLASQFLDRRIAAMAMTSVISSGDCAI